MVFSSVPVYLDPHNWHQQQNQGGSSENPRDLPLPPPPPPHVGGGGGTGSIRPGSMADRARLANLPQPEAGLKCPRCESMNTKFCYFNNYSLTQPRHFCKTCRRYWTRGGALRNVPVGGGCRRNKRSKSRSRSKSPALTAERGQRGGPNNYNSSCSTEISGHFPPPPPQLPLMASLQSLTQYGAAAGNMGLNFGGIQGGGSHSDHMGFQLGSNCASGSSGAIFSQHFTLMGNFEAPTGGLYPFQSEGVESQSSLVAGDGHFPSVTSTTCGITQLNAPVKMEGNRGLNLSKQFLGISENNQYWGSGGNTWTAFSGLNSSSTPNLL